jgi:hypothetical protein
VRPGDLDAGSFGKPVKTAGGRMPVHPGAADIQQDRPASPGAYCPVNGTARC